MISGNDAHSNIPFDWTTTYAMKMDYIPETVVSVRVASKILLVGKAVKLLQVRISFHLLLPLLLSLND